MAVTCLGCGGDITEDRVRRLLQSEASKHVLPLWSSLFQDALSSSGVNFDVLDLVRSGGKMCRQCFTALERCSRLVDDVKGRIQKAVHAVGSVSQQRGAASSLNALGAFSGVGGGMSRVVGGGMENDDTSTRSPDVVVSVLL